MEIWKCPAVKIPMDYVGEEKKFCYQLRLPGLITCHMNGEKKSKNAMASASIYDQLIKHLERDASIHFSASQGMVATAS